MPVAADPVLPVRARADGRGVTLALHVHPGARREGLEGVVTGADGTARLRIALTVAAEDGKANTRLVALLAKRWKLPRSSFTIGTGARARLKTLLIAGDAAAILARISADPGLKSRKDTT